MKEQQQQNLVFQQTQGIRVFLMPPSDSQDLYKFILTPNALRISSEHDERIFQFKDIIAVKLEHIVDQIYKVKIVSFPFRKRLFRKEARTIEQIQFWAVGKPVKIQKWHIQVLKIITNREIKSQDELKLIAYFNPVAGSNSKAQMDRVQQFISHTNFRLQVIETKSKNFCKQHIREIDFKKYQGVLIVSGDGLMHEFVNSQCCGKIPVSHVPAGSGNAFSKTQTSEAKEQCTTEIAVFLAVKGRTKPFNLFKVQLQKQPQPIYSFLSLEWAFLADIDINSQFLRFFGGLRFEIYSVWRVIAMRRYPGKLYYSFEPKQLPNLTEPITDQAFHLVEGQFLNTLFTTIPFITEKHQFSPLLKIEDRAIDMQFLTTQHGRWNLIKYLLNSQTGAHFDRQKQDLKEGVSLGWGKIKCYRLEPTGEGDSKGLFGIDGQHYQAQKIQVSLAEKQLLSFV